MSGRKSPQKRAIRRSAGNTRFAETGWWCAQSYANPSQRRFHTGNRGNPLFSAFFSQNGEFKSKGFRFPCVLSVGFRAMWRPATARWKTMGARLINNPRRTKIGHVEAFPVLHMRWLRKSAMFSEGQRTEGHFRYPGASNAITIIVDLRSEHDLKVLLKVGHADSATNMQVIGLTQGKQLMGLPSRSGRLGEAGGDRD